MRLLIIYDIPSDRIRARVADACLDYGLERIQYSAFAGELGRAHQRELELKIRRLLGRAPARIRFMLLDERLWERQQIIERGVTDAPIAPAAPDGSLPVETDRAITSVGIIEAAVESEADDVQNGGKR